MSRRRRAAAEADAPIVAWLDHPLFRLSLLLIRPTVAVRPASSTLSRQSAPTLTDTFHGGIMARPSVMSSVFTDRFRDFLTDLVLRLFCVDTGANVACEAGLADVANPDVIY